MGGVRETRWPEEAIGNPLGTKNGCFAGNNIGILKSGLSSSWYSTPNPFASFKTTGSTTPDGVVPLLSGDPRDSGEGMFRPIAPNCGEAN